MKVFVEDQEFIKLVYCEKPLKKGEYENCTFVDCDFSNSNLSEILLVHCEFLNCNISLVNLFETSLRNVQFKECKILGINFQDCN